jgi:hypothetical protein
MAETPEQKYNRIAAAVQQTILDNFPNPARVGCPGSERLGSVAARSTTIKDGDWEHITHCSPCYEEFLGAKEQARHSGHRARILGLIGGVAVLLSLLATIPAYSYLKKAGIIAPLYSAKLEPATLNLKDSSGTRGDTSTIQKDGPIIQHRPLALTIILPFGSEPGSYQYQLVNSDGRVLKSGNATASIVNGGTVLDARLDTSKFAVGDYRLGLRQGSFDWVFHPFRIR